MTTIKVGVVAVCLLLFCGMGSAVDMKQPTVATDKSEYTCGVSSAVDITTKDEIKYYSTTDGKAWDELKEGSLTPIGTSTISLKLAVNNIEPVIQILPYSSVVVDEYEKSLNVVQHNTACYTGYYGVSESITAPWTAYWYVDLSRKDPFLIYSTWKPRSVYTAPISDDQLNKNIVDPVKAGTVPSLTNIMEMVM